MNSLQIEYFLKNNEYTRPHFIGVFPADRLPTRIDNKLNKAKAFVMNLSPSHEKGSHWVAVIVSKKSIEIFDTGGIVSLRQNQYLKHFIKNHPRPRIIFNKCHLQGYTTDVCGEHCVMYLLCRFKNISFRKYLDIYSYYNLKFNDLKIFYLFLNNFVMPLTK